jgi:DNA repair exonuclease SbcCD ATPase subunit
MEIVINNLKKHKFLKLQFDLHGISLIEGKSGIGKSTILNAIMFCVYNVSGNKMTKNVSVEIQLDNIFLTRSKSPNYLKVVKEDLTLVDEEAQKWIDQNLKITHIAQFGFDSFISSNYQDRKSKLENLIGLDTELTLKLEQTLSNQKKKLETEHVKLSNQLKFFTDLVNSSLPGSKSDLNFDILLKKLEQEKLNKLLWRQNQEVIYKKQNLKTEIDELKTKLQDCEKRKQLFETQEKYIRKKEIENILKHHKTSLEIENVLDELIKNKNLFDNLSLKKQKVEKQLAHLKTETNDLVLTCPWENCFQPIEFVKSNLVKSLVPLTTNPNKRKRTLSENEIFHDGVIFLKNNTFEYNVNFENISGLKKELHLVKELEKELEEELENEF